MDGTLTTALIIAVPVGVLLVGSLIGVITTRSLPAILSLLGAVCLTGMVLTHVAEARHWLPQLQWGLPDSIGHYVDLTSTVLGLILLVGAVVAKSIRRARHT